MFHFLFTFKVVLSTILIEISGQFEIIVALLEYKIKGGENITEHNENLNPILICNGNINYPPFNVQDDINENNYI